MPRFDFRCLNDNCDTDVFEAQIKPNEKITAQCPNCGTIGKRLYTRFNVEFKGPGFHVNDYPKH